MRPVVQLDTASACRTPRCSAAAFSRWRRCWPVVSIPLPRIPCTPSANASSKSGSIGRTIGILAVKTGCPPRIAGLSFMPPLLLSFDHPRGDPNSSHIGGDVVHDCSSSTDDRPRADGPALNNIRPHSDVATFSYADITSQMRSWVDTAVLAYLCIVAYGNPNIEATIAAETHSSAHCDPWEHHNAPAQLGRRGHVRQRGNGVHKGQTSRSGLLDQTSAHLRQAYSAYNGDCRPINL